MPDLQAKHGVDMELQWRRRESNPRKVPAVKRAALVAHVTATLAILTTPVVAEARDVCNTKRCNERVARKNCSQTRPKWCVERAILTYRLNAWQRAWMRRVPGCESGWNPYARNPSGSTGLFQFMPSTWATTPYGHRSIYSAKWQSLGAAFMLRAGRSGEWVCK
jgi:hypothetical protein